jgi:ligand-binding sensor domain-containing protein/two-component sensor histidine kinase
MLGLTAFSFLLKSELLPIRTYTTADGLASDTIYRIVVDSRGFLWFCTPEGLSRFDGYRFITYGLDQGLPHAAINALIETRSGDHWIGTPRGLSRIATSGKSARFINYRLGPEAAANNILALLETRRGEIWAATAAGLFEWTDPRNFRHREFRGLERAEISDMVEDPDGNLWIATRTGIYECGESGAVQNFTVKDGLPGNWVEMLLLDSKGRLWAALRTGLALITRGATGGWSVEKVYSYNSGLVGPDVKALYEASDGTLWVGTSLGISRLRLGASESPVFQTLTRAQGLSDRQITALAEDQAGNLWVGTESAGVMRINRLGFTTYLEQDGLTKDRVFSVFEDRTGDLLAVTLGPGNKAKSVDVFDGVRFHSVPHGPFAEHPTWGWNQILLQSRTGEWWAATKQGLCRYPAMKPADLDDRNPKTCYSGDFEVFRIFEDSKGGIWASAQSSRGDQLIRWDPRTKAVAVFPPRIAGEPSDDLVSAFAEDGHGNIWMGLYKGGLYRYDGRGFQSFKRSDGLPGGSIVALFVDESGLWIGSNNGLGRVENTGDERPRIEIYNAARGMASNIVLCITSDRQGRIYAGTGNGVDRLDPKTGHIRHFSSANGLPHGEFTSALRDHSGSLWFATKQGLSRLIPTADPTPVAPRVLITDLQIGGASYPVSQLGEARVSRLELKPSQNQVQVEFVGLDYEPGDVLRYSYKLEGADSEWSPPRSQHAVNYAALSGGKYHFLVKAVTSEGVESAAPAEIEFIVLPPVWQRWWFVALCACVVMSGAYGLHRNRVAHLVQLERVRTRIATDLHDDIGASLSQIAVVSEVLSQREGAQDQFREPLSQIANDSRELVASMSDLVWSIDPRRDHLHDLVQRMRRFSSDMFTARNIQFRFHAPAGDLRLGVDQRRQIFLIFKEGVNNIVRHSDCTEAEVGLTLEANTLVLRVHDNGRGLDLSQAGPGNGLVDMQARAGALGGQVEITGDQDCGTDVTLKIPLDGRPTPRWRAFFHLNRW